LTSALSPSSRANQTSLESTAELVCVYGLKHAPQIRDKLDSKTQALFDQLHRAFVEIQKHLQAGRTAYDELQFPETTKLPCPNSQNRLKFFLYWKERSYEILPFPQKVILFYKAPELEPLGRIEKAKMTAFQTLKRCLEITAPTEEKSQEVSSPPPAVALSLEQQIGLKRLYFGGGALVYDQKVIYFSQMVGMWASLDSSHQQKKKELLDALGPSSAPDSSEPVPALTKSHPKGTSFLQFLSTSSIEAVERNLNLRFSSLVIDVLQKQFISEQVRSDLCYFTADLPRFYALDLSKYPNRPSAFLVRSFQIYFFLTRNFELDESEHPFVLTLVLYMSPMWNGAIPDFADRSWHTASISQQKATPFQLAWHGVTSILKAVTKKELEESSFANRECWDLLFLLWQSRSAAGLISIVCKCCELPDFTANLDSVLSFCRENAEALPPSMTTDDFIVTRYKEILDVLKEKGKTTENSEQLFFDPPLQLKQKMVIELGNGCIRTKRFIDLIASYPPPETSGFYAMLRQYILHPHGLFDLLKDLTEIGGEVTPEVLAEALSKPHEALPPNLSAEQRTRGKQIAKKLHQKYHFSSLEIFLLYLEFLRLIVRNEVPVIAQISKAVRGLIEFCPALHTKDIYFLFHFHPPIQAEQVAVLKAVRDDWAKSEAQLKRFIIDQNSYNGIIHMIEQFSHTLAAACKDDTVANKFTVTCQRSLLSAYFPPLQPLTDYFRITNLTVAEGIRWGEPVWATHLGQLKWILGESKIGIYFHWSIQKDKPVLFLSFFNLTKQEACSSFISIDVSAAGVSTEEKRRDFYGLLGALANQVLKEEANSEPSPDAPETPESWIPCFTGVQETLDQHSAEYAPQIWYFLRRVKLAYRNLFLSSIAGRHLPEFPAEDPKKIGALGHIFPNERGSLIPEYLNDIEPHPEFYAPDANPEKVAACQTLFQTRTEQVKPLDLNLQTTKGNLPIFFRVQTAEDLYREPVEFSNQQNEVAPANQQREGHYVTLQVDGVSVPLRYPAEVLQNADLFSRYFDYHNLLLKAAVYSSIEGTEIESS
jgi:hypothetical protein